ncbi:AAA family ATPase [Candidatus Acetothermia bacterium]|nr:MAG: AAA family ATPase [Candidatus Acetothermia bacterium]
MSKMTEPGYRRPIGELIFRRLVEPRRFIQVIAGPRQVGKTTLIGQVLSSLDLPHRYVSADEPTLRDRFWLEGQWEAARLLAGDGEAVLVIDEVQKISDWPEAVKRLWDEDTNAGRRLKVVLLGSAPLLVQQGLTESLAGRFEIVHLPHWSYAEMKGAFGWDVDRYVFYGGYPGAAPLIGDHSRWSRYILDSLIETTISRDVLLHSRITKPALLRRLFELACAYSGQVLSYTKMLGQLHDAGNTTTLAHYLDLLAGVGMVVGLQKYAKGRVRRRGSSPKLQVMNTALMSATSGFTFEEAHADRAFWGRLVESAVGAHLVNVQSAGEFRVFYWRAGDREVDFVVETGRSLIAIEIKSGRLRGSLSGMAEFDRLFHPARKLLVGGDGISVEGFLTRPVSDWLTG